MIGYRHHMDRTTLGKNSWEMSIRSYSHKQLGYELHLASHIHSLFLIHKQIDGSQGQYVYKNKRNDFRRLEPLASRSALLNLFLSVLSFEILSERNKCSLACIFSRDDVDFWGSSLQHSSLPCLIPVFSPAYIFFWRYFTNYVLNYKKVKD